MFWFLRHVKVFLPGEENEESVVITNEAVGGDTCGSYVVL
jgi:hypothetical protein